MLSKKVAEGKIGIKGFNLTKKWFHSTKVSKQSSTLIFFCASNIFPLIIVQAETVKLNVRPEA